MTSWIETRGKYSNTTFWHIFRIHEALLRETVFSSPLYSINKNFNYLNLLFFSNLQVSKVSSTGLVATQYSERKTINYIYCNYSLSIVIKSSEVCNWCFVPTCFYGFGNTLSHYARIKFINVNLFNFVRTFLVSGIAMFCSKNADLTDFTEFCSRGTSKTMFAITINVVHVAVVSLQDCWSSAVVVDKIQCWKNVTKNLCL